MKNRKGFTVPELVIVLVVVAVLAALLIPNFTKLVKAESAEATAEAMQGAANALSKDLITAGGDYSNIIRSSNKSYEGLYSTDGTTKTYTVIVGDYTCVFDIVAGTWSASK